MTEIVFAQGDDWQGIYVDGTLVAEDHRIIANRHVIQEIFDLIPGVTFEAHPENYGRIEDYLDEHGSFPDTLDELNQGVAAIRPGLPT